MLFAGARLGSVGWVLTWLCGLASVAHATPGPTECVAPAADPANTYDAAHTYAKLSKQYPQIRIASAALPASVRKVAALTYVQYGNRCLQLDLYLPAADTQPAPRAGYPLLVLVHGGGWRAGNREEFAPLAVQMAQQGWAAATLSYRLSGEAAYPAAIHDVRAAVRWLRSQAQLYQLDAQRFALAGGSAGGQIASLAGVTAHLPAFDGPVSDAGVSAAVQAMINLDGLSDFTAPAALQYEDDAAKQPSAAGAWFGGRYAEQTARWRAASPVYYVRPGMPPMLFIVSSQPRFSVGREQMMARMREVGVDSATLALPDSPHSFWMFEPWLEPTVQAMLAFLKQQLPER